MSDRIHLLVGGRDFIAGKDTLTQESEYFRALLSEKFQSKDSAGRYFVDADPDLFQDILRYLRRGFYPLYWNRAEGHNYVRYLALREEVRYFQIDRLLKWLEDKKYLLAVTTKSSVTEYKDIDEMKYGIGNAEDKVDSITQYVSFSHTDKIYICPRGISLHRGEPRRCGRQCDNARGESDTYEDEVKLIIYKIDKKFCVNESMCKDKYEDSE